MFIFMVLSSFLALYLECFYCAMVQRLLQGLALAPNMDMNLSIWALDACTRLGDHEPLHSFRAWGVVSEPLNA